MGGDKAEAWLHIGHVTGWFGDDGYNPVAYACLVEDSPPASLRAALDTIGELLDSPEFGHSLCRVLSALRGPDGASTALLHEELTYVKAHTTAVIRRAAFPALSPFALGGMAKIGTDAYCPLCAESASVHFASHVSMAAEALGLHISRCPKHTGD